MLWTMEDRRTMAKSPKGKLGLDTATLSREQVEAIERLIASSSPVYTRPSRAI